jgi:predicted membrane protein
MKIKRKISYKPTPLLFIIILFLIVIIFFSYYSNHSYYDLKSNTYVNVGSIFNYIFFFIIFIFLELFFGLKIDYVRSKG